jgi:hypothetical protein
MQGFFVEEQQRSALLVGSITRIGVSIFRGLATFHI